MSSTTVARARVEALRDECLRAGVQADIPSDIHHALWSKFVFIAPMSGIGAATRVPIGVWRAMPEPRELATRAIREIVDVARARGVDLGGDAAIDRTLARFDGLPPESTSSLQRDIIDGKPSELDAQLGAVVRLGRETNVPTPVCETLLALLLPQENAREEATVAAGSRSRRWPAPGAISARRSIAGTGGNT